MKFIKLAFTSLMITGLFFLSSCKEDDVTPDEQNIVELAASTADLSLLVEALEITELTSALEGTAANTVFAPTNQAFEDLLATNPDWNSLSDIDKTTLTNVLLFHVVSGSVKAADLTNDYVNTLSTGPNGEALSLQIDISNGVIFNGSAAPITTDIEATNGVVHTINEVMLPPSVVNIALNNSDFSILVAALTRSDLTTDYVSTLTSEGPFTVFAPTNEAFENLLNSNPDWNSLDDIPVATLEAVLNYHVVGSANVQSRQLSDNQEITSLGGKLIVDLSSGAKLETSSNQSVSIILTDVQGINGVVHVVNEVLLP